MSKVYFMCKKSFKVWYLGHSTQDLHRNRIYKIFFQIEKSCFPCPECQKNVRNTFFRLFRKFHKKNHGRVMTVSRTPPPLRGGGVRFPMTVLGAVPLGGQLSFESYYERIRCLVKSLSMKM